MIYRKKILVSNKVMVKHICDQCGKEFSNKSHYTSHIQEATDCGKETEEEPIYKFSKLSRDITNKIDKQVKKVYGIYFTPPITVYKSLEILDEYMGNISSVLEPSCGSGEYIRGIRSMYPHLTITGIEIEKTIFESISIYESENVTLFNENFLTYNPDMKYDLVIGNPPYYVLKLNDVDRMYRKYFDGRPNLFILFIIKSLHLLNSDGIMSLVLPQNFLNCLYYDKTRKYIFENYSILHISECHDKYIETQQNTILFIVQNKKPIDNMIFTINLSGYTIFGTPDNIITLNALYKDSTTLSELGFNVNVGSVVWNQNKDDLTDDDTKPMLVYSPDISNNELSITSFSNPEKKNYINKKGHTAPLLVLNRGYGMGEYKFNYCIINEYQRGEYLVENHLMCIKHLHPISNENLIQKYREIICSFNNTKTNEFIKIYFGNNAINTTELCKILPIYDI